MDSLSGLIDGTSFGPTVVVVHSPRARTVDCKKPCRVLPKTRDVHDARNYLPGGPRQQADLVKAQARELRRTNSALAEELLRTRQESEREICGLRGEVMDLGTKVKAERERLALLKDRLAAEGRARAALEEAHSERVRNLQKRVQAEALLRTAAEQELARARDKAGAVAVQLRGMEQELESATREAGQARDARLELETALNRERRERAEQQGELEAARSQLARERQAREVQARATHELEATIRGLTERNSVLFEEARASEAALRSEQQSHSSLEATTGKQRQELRLLGEQLEVAKRAKAAEAEERRQLAKQVAELEATAALSIAKDAHYDDLKADHDAASAQLVQTQGSLDKARGEVRSLTAQLQDATALAAKVPGLEASSQAAEATRKALEEQLRETQSAGKLTLAAVEEKDEAMKRLFEQLAEAQHCAETLRRGKEELSQQAVEKDACIEALRQEARSLHDDASGWQHRAKQLQELTDALHLLTTRVGDEQASAANDRRRLEGLIKSLEARSAQTQMELARCKDELRSAEQGQTAAHAEFSTAQEECAALRVQLHEEQLRASKLRSDLASLSSNHGREVESRGQAAAELLSRLQAEEGARQAAQQEVKALRRRAEELEASLAEAVQARSHSVEAYEASQAALESMRRKLEIYKKENKNLLSSYDDWLKTLTTRPQ